MSIHENNTNNGSGGHNRNTVTAGVGRKFKNDTEQEETLVLVSHREETERGWEERIREEGRILSEEEHIAKDSEEKR